MTTSIQVDVAKYVGTIYGLRGMPAAVYIKKGGFHFSVDTGAATQGPAELSKEIVGLVLQTNNMVGTRQLGAVGK